MTCSRIAFLLLALGAVEIVGAQSAMPVRAAIVSPARQIAAAVAPLPAEFRDSARVLGYGPSGGLQTLREGNGAFTCLASDPRVARFHVACYHQSLEPFMARGRALRAAGVTGDAVDSARFAEIKSGKLALPTAPAALYSLTGPLASFDTTSGAITGARPLFVIYVPGATGRSTGLSEKPAEGTPWIMFPGTPKAHIMFVPKM